MHKFRVMLATLVSLLSVASGVLVVGNPAMASPSKSVHGLSPHRVPLFRSGQDFSKSSTLSVLSTTFVYAGGHQILGSGVTAQGAAANLLVAEPYLDTTNDGHSLGEVAVRDTVSGNTIEIGWTIDQGLNGDVQAHLFTGAWDSSGFLGYNATAAGYVDNSSNAINAGANLHAVATNATFTSRIKKFLIQHDTTVACGSDPTGGWWVSYDNVYVGCYKNSTWPSGFGSINNAEYFGEVVTFRTSGKPCSDGGNGKPGNSYTAGGLDINDPAFFASTSWVNPNPSTTTSVNSLYNQDAAGNNTAAEYDAFSIGSTGNRTFTYGGKGSTSTGTTPGNYATC